MSDVLPELKRLLLKRLKGAKGQKLGGKKFGIYAADQKRLGVDAGLVASVRDELVRDKLVAEQNVRGALSYHLTAAGHAVLDAPVPPPAGYDETLLPYQKSYLLLLLLKCAERKASLTWLSSQLDRKELKATLGFGQAGNSDKLKVNRLLAAWVLDVLARAGAVHKTEYRGTPSFALQEAGEELLGASEQYPTIKFTLTGQELANLVAVARHSGSGVADPPSAKVTPEHSHASPPSITAEQILGEFERLKEERFAQHGMVPIHELRQVVARQFGDAAAAHGVLDALLHDLRRKRQIRLVAIGNAGDATSQQLADSIPGENEIYFMIESAHEPAVVG